MSDSGKAVFLSYASQDAPAVERIAEALRASGVEVWFDADGGLEHGDAWDAKIRRQIKDCALFVPVISANTNARAEGYFRLEWKLAVDRSHLMADDAPFLFPVVVDDTPDATARVPDKFRDVQWTRLNAKDTPETLADRVVKLLAGADVIGSARPARASARRSARPGWLRYSGAAVGIVIALVYGLRPLLSPSRSRDAKPSAASVTTPAPPTAPLSQARQLTARARAMSLDKYDSSAEDFAAAENLIKRALELDPNDAEIWAFSSLLNFSFGSRGFDHAPARMAAARSQAERALSLDPDSLEGLFALARWQRDNEDPAVAEASFKKILARQPNHVGALSGLAWICDQTDRVDASAAFYERVAALPDGNAALARYTEFLLFFHRARFEEADRCIRQSVASQPSANSQTGQIGRAHV
jgi:Tfp pilus assembly protein PilF